MELFDEWMCEPTQKNKVKGRKEKEEEEEEEKNKNKESGKKYIYFISLQETANGMQRELGKKTKKKSTYWIWICGSLLNAGNLFLI